MLVQCAAWSAEARAADGPNGNPGPHRIFLGAGLEAVKPNISRDGSWAEGYIPVGITAGYGYCFLPWLELGAQGMYDRSLQTTAPDVFAPALSLRLSADVSSNRATELGLTTRAGLLYMNLTDVDMHWSGSAVALAADVRHRLSEHWAEQFSVEVTLGGAHRTPRSAEEDNFSQSNPSYTSLGFWFRALFLP
jgi:hypothetical protein